MKKTVSRYHPALAALHWVLAALLIGTILIGFVVAALQNTDPSKVTVLRWHMIGGAPILFLTIVRFVIRTFTAHPSRSNRSVSIAHVGSYVIVALVVASGFATAFATGLPAIVFGGSDDPLPKDFSTYPAAVLHAVLAILLTAFIVLHVAAVVYHRLVRRERIFGRMLFGRRAVRPAAPSISQADLLRSVTE